MQYWDICLMPGTQPDLVATYHPALLPERKESINRQRTAPRALASVRTPAIGVMRRTGCASTAASDHYRSSQGATALLGLAA
ncbi:hypothetical protein [Streptomyces sp. MUSC 14]|uniref:hypothetical protein n=1 Tax=unclassified Streptomyces TaxID=2593676 RepID=UPI0015A70D08|nr:hypothetical protein [Streptomyces sp. MUSC 14]